MPYSESSPADREPSQRVTDAWVRASGHVLNSVVEANRAALAAFGFDGANGRGAESGLGSGAEAERGVEPEHRGESDRGVESEHGAEADRRVEFDRAAEPDWAAERTVESLDDLGLGDAVTFTKSIDDEDIVAFARASGDTNPLHLSDAFAERTRFGGRIAHGTLVSGVVSAALARLPGEVIYLSQETRYLNPVRPGDTVTAEVEVTEVLGDDRYRLSTVVTADDRDILEGEAVVLVEASPNGAPESDADPE